MRTQSSGVVGVPDALHPQPLEEQWRRQLSHQVDRQGVGLHTQTGLSNTPNRQVHPGIIMCADGMLYLSDLRRPRHRDLIGHGRRQAYQGGDVERPSWPLLLHAVLRRRRIALDAQQQQNKGPATTGAQGVWDVPPGSDWVGGDSPAGGTASR